MSSQVEGQAVARRGEGRGPREWVALVLFMAKRKQRGPRGNLKGKGGGNQVCRDSPACPSMGPGQGQKDQLGLDSSWRTEPQQGNRGPQDTLWQRWTAGRDCGMAGGSKATLGPGGAQGLSPEPPGAAGSPGRCGGGAGLNTHSGH